MKKLLLAVLFTIAVSFALGCAGGGAGAASTVTTTNPGNAPAAPTGLIATSGNAQVSLSWIASSDAATYNVYYGNSSGVSTSSTSKVIGLTGTNYSVTSLTNGTAYYFIVTAVSATGESLASSQVMATPSATTVSAPVAPTVLIATALDGQVILKWDSSAGASSYNLYYSQNPGVTPANGTKISGITNVAYMQTGLTNGTTYYYVVTAIGPGGESAASPQATAKPTGATSALAAAPTGLTATPGNAQLTLSWSASSGATGYNIYYGNFSSLSTTNGTRAGSATGTSYTITGLVNGTAYYVIVTAVNGGGESSPSSPVAATPISGSSVSLVPGTATTATLQTSTSTLLTFNFPSNTVSTSASAALSSLTQAGLPTPLTRSTDTFAAAFALSVNPASIITFNAPVTISGTVSSSFAANTALVLARLQSGAWVDVATFLVGASGVINQNATSTAYPGVTAPGTYLLYQPAAGGNTSTSNLGVALCSDGSNTVQVAHLYDSKGSLLSKPILTSLNYGGRNGLSAVAVSPDGSQGLTLSSLTKVLYSFSGIQTGTLVAGKTVNLLAYSGGSGEAIVMLPGGDEAVVSGGSASQIVAVSGISSGSPVAAATIPVLGIRSGLALSADGKVLLARGTGGLTVYSVASIASKAGSIGGTISHSFIQVKDFPTLGYGSYVILNGRGGMAISPADSSRAVVLRMLSDAAGTVQVMTGLTSTSPQAGTPINLPAGVAPESVAISPDGKLAVIGTFRNGLLLYSGVDTGNLTLVATSSSVSSMIYVRSVGITLDGKYVVAADIYGYQLVVLPLSATGFAAPVATLTITPPGDDELIVH